MNNILCFYTKFLKYIYYNTKLCINRCPNYHLFDINPQLAENQVFIPKTYINTAVLSKLRKVKRHNNLPFKFPY